MPYIKISSVLLLCGAAFGQTARFDAVVIRPWQPPGPGVPSIGGMIGGPGSRDPGLMEARQVNLNNLLSRAYEIDGAYQISGPSWLKDNSFDITAKVPAGATKAQYQLMLQNMLADRFGLKAHMEKKEVPSFDLVVAKSGAKLTPSRTSTTPPDASVTGAADDGPLIPRLPAMPGAGYGLAEDGFPIIPPGGCCRSMAGRNRRIWTKESMEGFAPFTWFEAGRPVRDATGLKGEYDFSLYWYRNCGNCSDGKGEIDKLPASPVFADALKQQLGLELVPSKMLIDVLVIDHLEKTPTEN